MTATFSLTGDLEPTVSGAPPTPRSAYVELDRPVVDVTNDVTYKLKDRTTVGPEFTLTGLPARDALNNGNVAFNMVVTIGARKWLVPGQAADSVHDLTEFPETTDLIWIDSGQVAAAAASAAAAAVSASDAADDAATAAAVGSVLAVENGDGTVTLTVAGGSAWTVSDNGDGTANVSLAGQSAVLGQTSLDAGNIPDLSATYTRVDEAPLNPLREGVTFDGVTDDSAAWAALMTKAGSSALGSAVHIPALPESRWSKVSQTINVPSYCRVVGVGGLASIHGTGTVPVMTISGANQILDGLNLSALSGHVLSIPNAYNVTVRNSQLVQYDPTKSCIYHFGAGSFIDNNFDKLTINASQLAATASPIHLENSGNGLNGTQWTNLRFNGRSNMTVPFVRLRNTAPSGSIYASNHSFSDISAEICISGVIHASSVNGLSIHNVAPWDVHGNYVDTVFKFYTDVGAMPVRNILVSHSGRRGDGLAAGKYDVDFSSAGHNCVAMFMNPMHDPNGAAVIRLPDNGGLSIACNGATGAIIEASYSGAFKLPWPAGIYRGSAAVAGPGAMLFNSTTNKPNFSDGTNWRDAAGTIV